MAKPDKDALFESLALVRASERAIALDAYDIAFEEVITCYACDKVIEHPTTAFRDEDGNHFHSKTEYQELLEATSMYETLRHEDINHPFYDGPYAEDIGMEGYKPWMR